jgi:hypothetical protein
MINNTAICIVTYSKRFDIFKQTLQRIREQTNLPIYVAVNGDYGKEFNNEYRTSILNECLKYDNVYCNFYLTFRGLSKIWNDCIVNCGMEHVIITNDDIIIKDNFINSFISFISNLDTRTLLRVNNSYSTFYVNKQYIDQCGYFNENYLGIGWEDTEFTRRNSGGEYPSYDTDLYTNLSNEYNDLSDQGASLACVKYHNYNRHIFETTGPAHGINFRPYEKVYMDQFNNFWNF